MRCDSMADGSIAGRSYSRRVIDIPVPPFADFDTAHLFHRLLLLFLREVKQPGEPAGMDAFLLNQVLGWHSPRHADLCADCRPEHGRTWCNHDGPRVAPGSACTECGAPYPCRTVLVVAALSRFPAPWTPVSLVRAMKAVSLLSPDRRPDPSTTSFLLLDSDPQISAEQDPATGSWVIHVVERGQDRPKHLKDDAAFIDHLMDMTRHFTFPYPWVIPDGWQEVVRPGVPAARAWWERHAALPYWQNQQAEGAP